MTASARSVVMLTCQFEETLGGVRGFLCQLESPTCAIIPALHHRSGKQSGGSYSAWFHAIALVGGFSHMGCENDILIRRADDPSGESQLVDPSTIVFSGNVEVRQRSF
jgi:hypothetical protein